MVTRNRQDEGGHIYHLAISFCWTWPAVLGLYFLTTGIHRWALQTCVGSGKWQQLQLPGKGRDITGHMQVSSRGPVGFCGKVRLLEDSSLLKVLGA